MVSYLNGIKRIYSYNCVIRTIMTTESRLQKAMEHLEKNPYYEKYSQKIKKCRQECPEQLLEKIEQNQKRDEPCSSLKDAQRAYAPVLNPKQPLKTDVSPSQKKLDDVFKTDLVINKSSEEITAIWNTYHSEKDVIAAVIPKQMFNIIESRVSHYPTFIFPLPRSQGYEFFISQASQNTIHFTTLLSYQVHKENAPECLTIVHYKELIQNKKIVLMRGEYDKNVINAKEAQCLANQFQMYYGFNDEVKMKLLDDFVKKTNSFKHMDLVKELENIKLP